MLTKPQLFTSCMGSFIGFSSHCAKTLCVGNICSVVLLTDISTYLTPAKVKTTNTFSHRMTMREPTLFQIKDIALMLSYAIHMFEYLMEKSVFVHFKLILCNNNIV